MRRRRTSSNMNNVVHSGWMIKSPPERKLNAPFKIFRSQWKRRYFVLRKPSGSLPDQYELHYYKDEKCAAKKGSIDLEQCEQIIESLDSELFPYLLAIKTVCRNKVRIYYLAVDSEQEMGSWVQWLCHVCGMKQEDDPTDIPEARPPSVTSPPGQGGITSTSAVSNGRPWNNHNTATPATTTASHSSGGTTTGGGVALSQPLNMSHRVPSESSIDSSPSYIPLDNCTTGKPQRMDLSGSVESVPDFNAPSPPKARGGGSHQLDTGTNSGNEDEVFLSGSCQRPPKHHKEPAPPPRSAASMDLYTVPPVRPPRPGGKFTSDHQNHNSDDDKDSKTASIISYDIPPPRRTSPKLSTDSVGRKDSFGSSSGQHPDAPSECYDYPPPRLSSTTSSDGGDLGVSLDSSHHQPSPYQNIPPSASSSKSSAALPPAPSSGFDLNTIVPPPRPHQHGTGGGTNKNQGYDIPRGPKNRSSSLAPQMAKMSLVSSSPLSSSSLTSSSTTTGGGGGVVNNNNNGSQPPPRPHRPSQAVNTRTYLNTQDGQLMLDNNTTNPSREDYTNISTASSTTTSTSSTPPAIPPPRHNSNTSDSRDGSGVYHMPPPSSASSSTSSSTSSSVVPPARPPARSTAANSSSNPPPIAARNPDTSSSQNQEKGDDGGVIFSTNRTKSFKREHNVNVPIMKSNKAKTLPMSMPVPAPRPVPHSRPVTYSSSEEGEEEKTHLPISLLRSVPPAQDAESELKYIDLELHDSMGGQDAPKSSQNRHHHHHHHHHHQTQHNAERSKPDSSIEYRQIDFVKTEALKETKKEKDRQNDDHA